MPTRLSASDPLIDRLVAELGPVRPRRWPREAALLLGLGAAELVAFTAMNGMRPDLGEAMATPVFWWKSGSLAIVAGLALVVALVSLDPAVTTARRLAGLWRGLGVAVAVLVALGWLLDAGTGGNASMAARLDWREGVDCLANVVLLAMPALLGLVLVARAGATVSPERTATAIGLAAAGIAAFIFALCCDQDDPLYVAVWYGAAVVGIAGFARVALPRLLRW